MNIVYSIVCASLDQDYPFAALCVFVHVISELNSLLYVT